MLTNIHGFRYLDFVSDEGTSIKGLQLFVSYEDSSVTGQITDKLFIPAEVEKPSNLKVGDTIDVSYNRRGKVIAVKAIAPAKA
jgi:hypothetical protein